MGKIQAFVGKVPATSDPGIIFDPILMVGLRALVRLWVNAAYGCSVLNKLPSQVFKLFFDMAYDTRDDQVDMPIEAASTPTASDTKLEKLCSTVEQLLQNMSGAPKKAVCAYQLCMATTHVTDECPKLGTKEVKILGHN